MDRGVNSGKYTRKSPLGSERSILPKTSNRLTPQVFSGHSGSPETPLGNVLPQVLWADANDPPISDHRQFASLDPAINRLQRLVENLGHILDRKQRFKRFYLFGHCLPFDLLIRCEFVTRGLAGEKAHKFENWCRNNPCAGEAIRARFARFFLFQAFFGHLVPDTSSRGRNTALSGGHYRNERVTDGNQSGKVPLIGRPLPWTV
jgi:hypothetical protein